jgi:hypothetical protein
MQPGVLDILTVMDPDLIDPKCIAWIKVMIKQNCIEKSCANSTMAWRGFWSFI